MDYYLTTEESGLLRIESDDASVTFRCQKNRAQLLSILVSEECRRAGAGRSIISAAEAELFNRGISAVESDFLENLEGMQEFLTECGYSIAEAPPVVSVDVDLIMGARAVRKAMLSFFHNCLFMSAHDLMDMQWDELFMLFKKLSIPIERPDLDYFSDELSGVVYNDNLLPRAFIFCSTIDDMLYVDFLGGVSKKEPQYIMVALQVMLRFFENDDNREHYRRIAMLLSDNIVGQLLKRALDYGTGYTELIHTFHAKKQLEAPGTGVLAEITEISQTDPLMEILLKEYSENPMQKNVCWKHAYSSKFRQQQ